ncbi:MAG: hypothetical protein AAFU71_04915, partial [Cyanobacteria bacterium J06632_22]
FREEALERLSSPEQLDQLMQIVRPRSWLPLITLGGLIGVGLLWSILGRIPVTTTSHAILVQPASGDSQLIGVAHFDAGEIAQIEPGMEVLLIPDVEGSQQSAGGIYGTVSYVQPPQVMTLEGVRALENPEAPTIIEVIIDLEADPDSASGYRWSASSNKMFPLAGMPAAARITLDERAPIAFVLPFLDNQ